MTEPTEVQKAEQALAAAVDRVGKAQANLEAERRRIVSAEADLAALDARILATDPADMKALLKADGERTGIRIGVEVLRKARLPKAEAALAEARDAHAQVVEAVEAARAELALGRFHASGAKALEIAIAAVAAVKPILGEHAGAAEEAARFGLNVGEYDPLLKAHRLFAARSYGEAFRLLGDLVLARELATAEPSPLAVQERQRERERRDAHLAKLMADRAASDAANQRRRAGAGGGGLQPTGESFNDVKRL